MINENKIGFGFGNEEYDKVVDAILYLKNNEKTRKIVGENGYEFDHIIFHTVVH